MLRLRTLVIATSIALAACSQQSNEQAQQPAPAPASTAPAKASTAATTPEVSAVNPFLEPSTLPFQAPPFDKIKDGDYQPAFEEGMKQHLEEINKIADNPEAPTFENTFIPMEKSGQLLSRVRRAFFAVTGANTNDTLQKVQQEEAPKFAEHQDAIVLNDKLFKRIETIYDQRDSLKLDPESKRLVEVTYKNFVRGG